MTVKSKVAVIGVGYLGKIHAKIYHEMPNVDLVAVIDTNDQHAANIAQEFQCQALTDFNQLPDDIDAVSVVVPTSFHYSVASALIRRGVHMLLEKPIAPTVEESQKLVDLAAKHQTILQIGHLERFNAGVMKLAELSGSPRFIEVHRLSEFVERATDVDVVTDLMIHDIDIVLSLMQSDLVHVAANGTRVITDHVDIANARLEFANGAVANVTASRVSRAQMRRIRVFSDQHYLGLNFATQQLEEVTLGDKRPESQFHQLRQREVDVVPQLPLNAELAHFIDCVQHGKAPLVSGEHGLNAVKVAQQVKHCIEKSMQMAQTI